MPFNRSQAPQLKGSYQVTVAPDDKAVSTEPHGDPNVDVDSPFLLDQSKQLSSAPASPTPFSFRALFNLERNYSFYGAYHCDPINKAIHMVFVWPILFSAFMILQYTPSVQLVPASVTAPLCSALSRYLPFPVALSTGVFANAAAAAAAVYAVFYVAMERRVGSLAAVLVGACLVGSKAVVKAAGASKAWKLALAVQMISWGAQFAGHGVFEKRAPALLDNLAQACLMAPFFVLLEFMERFGFEPYPGFHARVEAKVEEMRAEHHRKQLRR